MRQEQREKLLELIRCLSILVDSSSLTYNSIVLLSKATGLDAKEAEARAKLFCTHMKGALAAAVVIKTSFDMANSDFSGKNRDMLSFAKNVAAFCVFATLLHKELGGSVNDLQKAQPKGEPAKVAVDARMALIALALLKENRELKKGMEGLKRSPSSLMSGSTSTGSISSRDAISSSPRSLSL